MNLISEAEAGIRTLYDTTQKGFVGDASAGQNHINAWVHYLRSGDQKVLGPIVQELEALTTHIGNNNAAGMATAFQRMGELTAQAALGTHNFQGNGDKIRELSQKLITAAGNLRLVAKTQPAQH
ncbi:hypothetical protein ACFQ48_11835 [Hymenobacter caeli]|uniref:Uncharacterized protein n=1 Tax=Hymenobacter caeli TaxID=2735894 RepID=A0ABX2FS26_9BACT|nr:hypothetical protein [Hymenobacter caeli]NRT19996.1 hypothetical protein [Hymenobacter caeli]